MKQQSRGSPKKGDCGCAPSSTAAVGIPIERIRIFRAALRILERGMAKSLDSQTECCGVTLAQCHVLMELDGAACTNVTSLSAALGLDKSTLSRTVDGLVNIGLVDRSVNPLNRRQQVVCLSPSGRKLTSGIHRRCDEEYRRLFGEIPQEKHATILEAVELLANAVRNQRMAEK